MTSLTLSVNDEMKDQLKSFMWVNWSEIAREEALKKLIFEKYLSKEAITAEEWEFCEKIDWHPVDDLPLKKEFLIKLFQRKKTLFIFLKDYLVEVIINFVLAIIE